MVDIIAISGTKRIYGVFIRLILLLIERILQFDIILPLIVMETVGAISTHEYILKEIGSGEATESETETLRAVVADKGGDTTDIEGTLLGSRYITLDEDIYDLHGII